MPSLKPIPSFSLSDVRFWLYESQGDVNVVLTLIFNRQTIEITIEKRELQNGRIRRTQITTISKSHSGSITVRNEPLVIEFDKLFLRSPETPKETNIYIECDKLEKLADAIWSAQDPWGWALGDSIQVLSTQ